MEEPEVSGQPGEEQKAAEERVERLVPLAKDIALVLVKTLKATGMYLPNNPVYKKFHDELAQKFEAYFALEDRLSLRINRFDLTFLDREVYHNPDKEANVALMFFKDGVREISFHKGLDEREAKDFIDILKFNSKEQGLDDDLVTLMWEKDFANITYTVTEDITKEETDEEETLLTFGEEPEALKQIERLRAMAQKEAAASAARVGQAGETGTAGGAAGHGFAGAAGLAAAPETDEGRGGYDSIRGTYAVPDDIELLTELTDIFYEILVTSSDMERFATVSDSLAKALDIFVARGDLALATILVMKVQELAASGRISEEAGGILDRVIERAASPTLIKHVGQYIEETGVGALEAAGSYLSQLDERAVNPIVTLLETASDRKARRALCDIVPVVAKGSARLLIPHLRHRIWYVARNVAMILGKMGDTSAVRPLGAALKHEEPRVRREALTSLHALGGAEAAGLVEGAMDDEVRAIRSISSRILAELEPARAFARLTESASLKEFRGRDLEEKKEVYELIGRTGGQDAVPFLAAVFRKKGLLGRAKQDELRACAAYGLAAAGGREALELLKSEAGAKSKALSAACAEGIRLMDSRRR